MAELADAQASGACVLRDVGVQVPPRAQERINRSPALTGGAAAVFDHIPLCEVGCDVLADMTLEEEVVARADVLMRNAPGQVSVRRISRIDDVRVLRAAREALTAAEEDELRRMRLVTMERLDGAVAAVVAPLVEAKEGLLGSLLSRWRDAAKGLTEAARVQGEYDQVAREAGALAQLPAPVELLDAAETWLLSHLVAGRVDADLSVLRHAWEDASIEPADTTG